MAVSYKRIDDTLTSSSSVLVYKAPVNSSVIVSDASAANTLTDARLVTVNVVPDGGSVLDTNKVIILHPVNGDDDEYLDKLFGKVLNAGDEIWMNLDDTGAVNIALSVRVIV